MLVLDTRDIKGKLDDLKVYVDKEVKLAIANEGLGFSDLTNSIVNFFSSGLKAFQSLFSATSERIKEVDPLPQYERCRTSFKHIRVIAPHLDGKLYSKVEKFNVPYLQGVTMQLDELTTRLYGLAGTQEAIVINYLKELNKTISMVISDPEFLSGHRKKGDSEEKKKAMDYIKNVEKLNQDMYESISDKTDIRTIGEVLPNLRALIVVNDNLVKLKPIVDNKLIYQANDMASSIHKKLGALRNENSKSKISKENLKVLSDDIYVGAQALTYLATVYYIISQSIYMFNGIVETIYHEGKK